MDALRRLLGLVGGQREGLEVLWRRAAFWPSRRRRRARPARCSIARRPARRLWPLVEAMRDRGPPTFWSRLRVGWVVVMSREPLFVACCCATPRSRRSSSDATFSSFLRNAVTLRGHLSPPSPRAPVTSTPGRATETDVAGGAAEVRLGQRARWPPRCRRHGASVDALITVGVGLDDSSIHVRHWRARRRRVLALGQQLDDRGLNWSRWTSGTTP
jgi:hypothetical protein